jgi:hypothetical protein
MQNKLDLIRLGNFKFQGEKILHFVCWWCWILLDACHSKKKNFCGLNDSNDLVKASWLLHLSLHIQIAIIRHASQLMHGITELTTSLVKFCRPELHLWLTNWFISFHLCLLLFSQLRQINFEKAVDLVHKL